MRHVVLHNPASQAHLEDLKDRLSHALTGALPGSHDRTGAGALMLTVTRVVQAMDEGDISIEDTRAVLSSFRIPGFCFDRWMAEMVEEGVYLEDVLARAA